MKVTAEGPKLPRTAGNLPYNKRVRLLVRSLLHHGAKRSRLDIRAGFALARDATTPVSAKLLALAIGAAVTVLMIAFEVPLEGLLGLLIPFVGEAIDLVFDGLEVVVLPVLIGAAVLPLLVPKRLPPVVRRYARAGGEGPSA